MTFQWKPQAKLSDEILVHMRQNFPRPSDAPPVAWFLAETQRYHDEITTQDSSKISVELIQSFLRDVASGTKSFGRLDEWDTWLRHLLPDLILRSHETLYNQPILDTLITAFMNIYWEGINEEYPGFSSEIMATLGSCLMTPPWWDGSDLSEQVFMAQVSASLFFCLKYLTFEEIPQWVESLSKLNGKRWNAYYDTWCQMLPKLYQGALQRNNDEYSSRMLINSLGLDWGNSELLIKTTLLEIIPQENVKAFLSIIQTL